MSGSTRPIGCCDSDCAGINHCCIGGYQCQGCGMWFCSGDVDADGYCDKCNEERFSEEEDEDFT